MAATATFSADFSKWDAALRNATAQLKSFEIPVKNVRGQLERMATSFSGAQIHKEAQLAVTAVTAIGGAAKLTNQELQRFGQTVDEAVQKAQRMGQVVPQAFKDMQADIRAAQQGVEKINFTSLGEKATRLGLVMTAAITAPIVGAGYAAVKFSTDFEQTMTKVVTLSGVSEEQMLKFRDAILDMAPAVGRGPNELAKALLVVTSTGIRGGEALEILKESAKASAVGLGETETIARAVTAAINSYGKENLDAAAATDILYRTVKAGGAEATELAPVLGRVTGVAAQLGVSFKEVGAFIATFTRLGVNAAESVTSLGGVMSTLLKPSVQAEKTLKELGTSMSQLRQEVKDKGLTQAMLNLVNATGATDDQLAVIIPNIRALRGVLGTAGAQADSFGKVLEEVSNEMDTLNGAFDRGEKTTARTFDKLKAQAESLAIQIGDGLIPVLSEVLNLVKPFLDVLIDMAKAFADLPKPLQDIIVGFVALLAALGPVIFALGRLAQAIAAVQGIGGMAGLSNAMKAMGLVTGGVIAGVGAATIAIGLLEQSTSDSVEAFKAGRGEWEDVGGVLANAVARGLVPFNAAWRDTKQAINDASNAWDAFKNKSKNGTDSLPKPPGLRPGLPIPDARGPGLRDFSASSKGLNAIMNELKETLANTAKDGFDKLRESTAAAKAELAKLSGAQVKELRQGLKDGSIDAKGLADALHGNEVAARMFQAQMAEVNRELKKDDAHIAAAAMKELVQDIAAAEKAGKSSAEILDMYGSQIEKITFAARQNSQAIPEMMKKWEVLKGADFFKPLLENITKGIPKLGRLGKEGADKWWTSIKQSADKIGDATEKAYDAMVKANEGAQSAIAARNKTATEQQIEQIERSRQAAIDALPFEAMGEQWQKAVDAINREAEELTHNLEHQGIIQLLNHKKTLNEQVAIDKQALEDIAAYNMAVDAGIIQGEKVTNEEIKRLKKKLKADMDAIAAEAGKSWSQKFGDNMKGALEGIAGDITQILVDAAIHGSSAKQVATALGTSIGGSVGGALGAAIGGPLGAAIGKTLGSALGGLIGKAFKTDGERAVAEVGREWGVTISEQMGEAIEETMKTKFEGMKNNRWAAEVFNLGEIIQDIGGVTQENVAALEGQLRQAFNFLHDGIFNVADVQKVLDDSFGQLTEFYTSRNAFISSSLLEVIKLDKELGISSKGVADFVEAQAGRAVAGFNKIAQNFLFLVTGFQTGSEDMKDLLKGIDDAIADASKSGQKAFAPEFIDSLKGKLGELGPVIQGVFGALINGGASVVEAIQQMGPGLEQIQKILTATGVAANGFVGQILGWQGIIDKNKELFEVLSGVDDALQGLHNSGSLTQESFLGLSKIVTDAFQALQSQGVKATDALALMAPQLQELWELQHDFGYVVDEATQKLLDQAVAAGTVGDAHRSVQEQMLLATERVADAAEYLAHIFGYEIPAAMDTTGAKAGELGDKFERTFTDGAKSAGDFIDRIGGAGDSMGQLFDRGTEAAQKFQNQLPDNIEVPIDFPVSEDFKLPQITGFSDALIDELEKIRMAMDPMEAAALSSGYSRALAEGFSGSIDAFQAQQLGFYHVLEEGDARLKTFFSDASIASYDAFVKVGEGMTEPMRAAMAQLRTIMLPSEAKSLADGYAAAIAEGFTGSLDAFQKQQMDYYSTLQEGDERLKTYFMGSTLEMYNAIKAGGEGVFDPLIAGIGAAVGQLQVLGPEGDEAIRLVINAMAELAGTGPITAQRISEAIIPVLQSLGTEGDAAIAAILAAIGQLPENIDIPVDFPAPDEIPIPRHAPEVSIPVTFPGGKIEVPEHPDDITIPIDFPTDIDAAMTALENLGDAGKDAIGQIIEAVMQVGPLSAEQIDSIVEGMSGLGEAGQAAVRTILEALADLPDTIPIHVDIPVPDIDIPEHPDRIEIPIDYPSGGIEVPEHPPNIDIPVYFPTEVEDALAALGQLGQAGQDAVDKIVNAVTEIGPLTTSQIDAIVASMSALGPAGQDAVRTILEALGRLPDGVDIPVKFPTPEITIPEYPDNIEIPVDFKTDISDAFTKLDNLGAAGEAAMGRIVAAIGQIGPLTSEQIDVIVAGMSGLGEAGQNAVRVILEALNKLPDDVSIPVDFQIPEIDIPEHPDRIEIPVDFHSGRIEVPEHPSDIRIPVDFPSGRIEVPDHPDDISIPVDFPAGTIEVPDHPEDILIPVGFPMGAFEVPDHPSDITIPVDYPSGNIEVPEHPSDIRIPVDFPMSEILIPDHPEDISIPVDFPAGQIEVPEHPSDIRIPVDFPSGRIEVPEHPSDISIPVGFPTGDIEVPDHPSDILIPVGFPTGSIEVPEHPDDIRIPVDFPTGAIEVPDHPSGIRIPVDFPMGSIEVPDHPEDILIPVGFPTGSIEVPDHPSDIRIPVDFPTDGFEIPEHPSDIRIPVDFPTGSIEVPDHPDDIRIPVDFPTGAIEVPEHPSDIRIPVDFPTGSIEVPEHPSDILIPVDFTIGSIEVPDHPRDISIPVGFPTDKIEIPDHPDDVSIPVYFPAEVDDALSALGRLGSAGQDAVDQIVAAATELGPMTTAQIDAIVASLASLGPEGQRAVQVILDALGTLPDDVEIPVDFPTDGFEIPDHPYRIQIPVAFPTDEIEIPDVPGSISIPVDVDLSAFDGLDEVRASLEALGPAGAQAFDNIEAALEDLAAHVPGASDQLSRALSSVFDLLPKEAQDALRAVLAQIESFVGDGSGTIEHGFDDAWGHISDGGVTASEEVKLAWIADQANAAGQISGPFSDAWGTISSEGVSMSEDVADAIMTIPDGMPEVRDEIINALTRAGMIGSGQDGIGRIAEALRDLPDVADTAISRIEAHLSDIDVPEIKIPVRFDQKNNLSDMTEVERVRAYSMGGMVYAANGMFIPRGTDTVPAMLTPGEFVVNRRAVNRIGEQTLRDINNGDIDSGATVRTQGGVTNYFTIQAWDGEDVVRVLTTDPRIQKAMGAAAMRGVEMGGDAQGRFDRRVKKVTR